MYPAKIDPSNSPGGLLGSLIDILSIDPTERLIGGVHCGTLLIRPHSCANMKVQTWLFGETSIFGFCFLCVKSLMGINILRQTSLEIMLEF